MITTLVTKGKKALLMVAMRLVGAIHPRSGTALATRVYRSWGMNIVEPPAFIAADAWFDSTQGYSLITIDGGCTISREVRVLTHDWSPHAALRALGRTAEQPVGRLAPVRIGKNAFIGLRATLLPGCTIGEGAIVGAGTVVRGEVPPFTIVAGNPMTIVGTTRALLERHYSDELARLED